MTENCEFGRKPLPLQRILSENVQSSSRLKLGSKPELKSQSSQEKENSKDELEETEASHRTPDDTVDTDWGPGAQPLSSTMALGALSTPNFFPFPTSSNVSSINCSESLSMSDVCQIPEKHFKTPSRKMGVADPELTPSTGQTQEAGTPRTPRWVSDRTPSSGPGSGAQRTPLSSASSKMGHNMRTPSTGASQRVYYSSYRTPSGTKLKTPSSGSSHSGSGVKNPKTPSSGSSGSTRWNPFDSHTSADNMLNPTMSPNVFSIVISPSQESETSCGGRFWSIDQQAEMFPAEISDESPYKQSIYIKSHSKENENRTQEQIDLYFAERHDITSPPDLPPTGPLMMDSPDGSFSGVGERHMMSSTATQTALSFPPVLPAQVEAMLKQYTTFTDHQCWTGPALAHDEPSILSNSTLRRKLFNAGTTSESSRSPSPETDSESGDCGSAPDILLTPGKVFNTPLTARSTLPSDAWSSSPVRNGMRKTSFSPPECMASPMFSPIVKGRRHGASQESSEEEGSEENEEVDEMETTDRSGARRMLHHDLTSGELYQTAEIECDDELGTDSASVNHMSMDVDSGTRDGQEASVATLSHSVVHVGDNWTLSMAPEYAEETEGGSKADTGYGTSHNTASITNITPGSASTSRQDSGVTTSTNVTDNTCGLSVLTLPASAPRPVGQLQQNVLMSYQANDTTNDISVGFPLGSSTPTKK